MGKTRKINTKDLSHMKKNIFNLNITICDSVRLINPYELRVQYSCGVMLVFWFWWEIVFGVTYVLSVQYSCAAVSVFWLLLEIVLKMRTCFYKKILLGWLLYYDLLADVCIS